MTTMELKVKRAGLARDILRETDETIIKNLWVLLKQHKSVGAVKTTEKRRTIGLLDGKVIFNEIGNGKITTDEFLGV